MRWQLLDGIDELVPGRSVRAAARTDFPPELFADHFPSFAVTPGVLLLEMMAQAAGLLVVATRLDAEQRWVFPALSLVRDAKFRHFVPPSTRLEIHAELESLHEHGAQCRGRVLAPRDDQTAEGTRRCASARLVFAVGDGATSATAGGDPTALRGHLEGLFVDLESPWRPPGGAP
ncbi:MAG: hypothetical protein AAGC60_19500 [Acidobacteriota bacterium]